MVMMKRQPADKIIVKPQRAHGTDNPVHHRQRAAERPVILAKPRPDAYSALSLVVQIFRPSTTIAGSSSPCAIITSEIRLTDGGSACRAKDKHQASCRGKATIAISTALGMTPEADEVGVGIGADKRAHYYASAREKNPAASAALSF